MSFGGDRALSTPILVTTKRLALRDEIFGRHSLFHFYSLFYTFKSRSFVSTQQPFVQLFADLQPADTWALHSQHQQEEMDIAHRVEQAIQHAVDMLLISWW